MFKQIKTQVTDKNIIRTISQNITKNTFSNMFFLANTSNE